MSFLALVFGLFLFSLMRLTSRYEYGPRTARYLKFVAAGSLAFALVMARFVWWPGLSPALLLLASAGIAVPVFVLTAAALVELLRKRKQRVYDVRLGRLRRREQELLGEVDDATRAIRAELRRRESAEAVGRDSRQDLYGYEKLVESWKHGGGAARIRSLKLQEWEAELRTLDAPALEERRLALERDLRQAEPERREQLEVQIALCRLVAGAEAVDGAEAESRGVEREASRLGERRRRAENELSTLRAEMAELQRNLADFLSKEIRLD